MNYTTSWNGLSGAPTSGGFYNGASGSAGTAVSPAWTMGTGWTGTGTTTGSMTLTSDQATQLRNGNWYYSMGTAANTGGEIRGQMTATAMP
ncbi:CHRD domain-containing protein [Sediminibacterium ginsengisoli]|uniref:CHRD domain-containing protein n=1 Tax=Sediminibacterium ginsengisoli TaxID=413434 RepID=A0A1T4P7P4_9BACT|nr:CHRD domain-containing protein [Sediminibacterium ginsengisoli]SJZ87236.1 CHRD domain-containing protein [Sediminibacterium ginsengisoli]